MKSHQSSLEAEFIVFPIVVMLLEGLSGSLDAAETPAQLVSGLLTWQQKEFRNGSERSERQGTFTAKRKYTFKSGRAGIVGRASGTHGVWVSNFMGSSN